MKKRIFSLILIVFFGIICSYNPIFAFFSDYKKSELGFFTGSVDVSITDFVLRYDDVVIDEMGEMRTVSFVKLNSATYLSFLVTNNGISNVDYDLEFRLGFEGELSETGHIFMYYAHLSDEEILLDVQGGGNGAIIGRDVLDDFLLDLSFGEVLGIDEWLDGGSLSSGDEQFYEFKLFFYGGAEASESLQLFQGRQFEVVVELNADVEGRASKWNMSKEVSVNAATIVGTVYPVIEEVYSLPKTFYVKQYDFESMDFYSYVEAIDQIEGDISYNLQIDVPNGLVENVAGEYEVTYTVANSLGFFAYPLKIKFILWDFAQIESGNYHTLALTSHGRVYAWGNNYYGQLGIGSNSTKTVPILIQELYDIVDIAVGNDCSYAVDKHGKIYSWGDNEDGQLGDGTLDNSNVPKNVLQPQGLRFVEIDAGFASVIAVTDEGEAYAWGKNDNGSIGDGGRENVLIMKKINVSNVKSASIGRYNGAAITEDGSLYTWGDSAYGRLGNGVLGSVISTPIKVEFFSSQGIKISQISVASNVLAAISEDGSIFTWGNGYYGQIGNGSTSVQTLPTLIELGQKAVKIDVSDFHTGVLTENGLVFYFGDNQQGQLGTGNKEASLIPVQLGGIENIKDITLGALTSLVLTDDNDVFSFGYGGGGMFGNNSNSNSLTPQKWSFAP